MKTIAGVLSRKEKRKSKLRPFQNGPEGAVSLSDDGDAYVITTKLGTCIAFDLCGRCSLNVKRCTCRSGSTLPRSIEYMWDSDLARWKDEEWNHLHPDYRGSFTAREAKRNLRMPTTPTTASETVVVVVGKSVKIYAERARKNREADVQRLLAGKRKR